MIITESKFQEVKEMLDYCKSTSFVAKKCGVSPITVNRIKNSLTLDDYKRNTREESKRKSVKPEENTGDKNQPDQRVMVVSYEQFKALAKDVDAIKTMLGQLVGIGGQLLDVWKGEG